MSDKPITMCNLKYVPLSCQILAKNGETMTMRNGERVGTIGVDNVLRMDSRGGEPRKFRDGTSLECR